MYKEIYDFARLRNLTPPAKNRKQQTIGGYIVLDDNGDYQRIELIEKNMQELKSFPTIGSAARVAKQAEVICEKAEYIFDKSEKKHPSWVETMLSGRDWCDSLSLVAKFIELYETDDDFYNKVFTDYQNLKLKSATKLSFRIGNNCIEDLTDWEPWLDDWMAKYNERIGRTTSNVISCISGELQESVPAKTCPEIKNVPNDIKASFGIGNCVYITSMGDTSYQSYGFDGAIGSQLGIDDANTLVAGFEYLLSNPEHRNKDFKTIYFYDKPNLENILSESFDGDNDELEEEMTINQTVLSNILQAVRTGEIPKLDKQDANYYMLQFNVPVQGRMHLSNETKGSYVELQQNLYDWYSDTHLIDYDKCKHDVVIKKFYSMLMSCISNQNSSSKSEDVEKEFGKIKSKLLHAIYHNEQIPIELYNRALRLCINSTHSSDKHMRRVWIQILKCYLTRYYKNKEKGIIFMPELMTENNTQAYACGRLFATYEQMQYLYANDLNKNLSQLYFAATMKQPSKFFPTLAKKGIVYMSKIKNTGFYERLLAEISEQIGDSFPNKFNQNEQGEFILGYYQQRGFFRKPKYDNNVDNDNTNITITE